jgi:hypothetical protein
MSPYELQMEVTRGYMRFYSRRAWLRCLFVARSTKKAVFHWWGRAIIRTWLKDEGNKAFVETLHALHLHAHDDKAANGTVGGH